jgi:hypothetical protein|tara:strand:- start:651 stop:1265 length:615 start_codon:yes stop_codon:yes gene_type:complete
MATKISDLTNLVTVAGGDLLVVVDEVANSASIETKKVTVNNFFDSLGVSATQSATVTHSGNTLSIGTSGMIVNNYIFTDTRITSQSNSAPYSNTLSTVASNVATSANAHNMKFVFGGSIQGSIANDSDGVPTVTITSSEDILQNPQYNTVRVSKLNISGQATPANNSYVNSTFEVIAGDQFYDNNYIYVAVSNTEIKRIAISAF